MCGWLCDIHVLFYLKMRRNVMFYEWIFHIHFILKFIKSFCFFLKIFVPTCKNRYWYVVIANTRKHRFEVICPFKDFSIVKEDALIIVSNFCKIFKCSYSVLRRVDVYNMGIVFASMSNSTSQYASFDLFIVFLKKSYHLLNILKY